MQPSQDPENLKQVDADFLKNMKLGDRLFHYPQVGDAQDSFAGSPSAKFTLYSIIGFPTDTDVTMIRPFDEKEQPESFLRSDLTNGAWWYNEGLVSPV